MRWLVLTLSIAGSSCVFLMNGCLDSTVVGLKDFRGQSPLDFEALLLCSFVQVITGMVGGAVTHHQLNINQSKLWGCCLLLFSTLLSIATYSFSIGGLLCGIAAFLAVLFRVTKRRSVWTRDSNRMYGSSLDEPYRLTLFDQNSVSANSKHMTLLSMNDVEKNKERSKLILVKSVHWIDERSSPLETGIPIVR